MKVTGCNKKKPIFNRVILCIALLFSIFSGYPLQAQYTDPLSTGHHRAPIRGVMLYYNVQGNGPVVFLQPEGAGWGGDATIYAHILEPLQAYFTLIYLDPRGIGHSDRLNDPGGYSLLNYVQDLEALREYLDLPSVTIIGHGHGGFVALQYALLYPDRLNKLILIGTSPFSDTTSTQKWLETKKGYTEARSVLEEYDSTILDENERLKLEMKTLLPLIQFSDFTIAQTLFVPLVEETNFSAAPYEYFYETEAPHFDIRENLHEITMPVLVVCGEDEVPLIRYGSDIIRETAPYSDMVVIENTGHWPMIERPDVFFPEVIAFLRD